MHDGYCGYRAVAREEGVSYEYICKSLHTFAQENPNHTLSVGKARWEYAANQVASKETGIDRKGWLNAFEDCKYYLMYVVFYDVMIYDFLLSCYVVIFYSVDVVVCGNCQDVK